MKNNIIGFDLDEILAELLDYILEYNDYKIWDNPISRDEVKDYYIHKMPNLELSEAEAISWFRTPMFDEKTRCDLQPTEWSLEKLQELKKAWNKLVIITARIESIFWEYTEGWINKHFPDIFDDIVYTDHFTEKSRNKWDVCNELLIKYMIEDNMDYALELAKNWIKTYILEKPWNIDRKETHDNLIKIKKWKEFL